MNLKLPLVGFLSSGWLLAACAGTLPGPPLTRHPPRGYVEVPYPPPVALAEVVPRFEATGTVWIDGFWSWRGKRYVWLRGGWMLPPAGARYAPWQFVYGSDGTLWFAEGAWYDSRWTRLKEPETLMPARTPANEVTPEDQTSH